MAKLQTKSDNIKPYGGLFSIFKTFDNSSVRNVIDIKPFWDGNTNVKFHQKDTLERIFGRLENESRVLVRNFGRNFVHAYGHFAISPGK